MSMLDPVFELVRGLFTSGRMMFEKPVTFQYPEQKREVRPRFRGRHVLKRYDNGLEKCIGCSLCAAACPAASGTGWAASMIPIRAHGTAWHLGRRAGALNLHRRGPIDLVDRICQRCLDFSIAH